MCEAVHRAYSNDSDTHARTIHDKPSTIATCTPWDTDQYIKQLIEAPTGCTALPSLQLDVQTGLNSSTHLNKEGFIDSLSNTTQEFVAKQNLMVSKPFTNKFSKQQIKLMQRTLSFLYIIRKRYSCTAFMIIGNVD
jgi:predicted aconitase